MAAASVRTLVTSIIKIRSRLLKSKSSGKNEMLCHRYIRELNTSIDAYGKRWDDNGWKQFAKRNSNILLYLIPENKSGETLKKRLSDETL